MSTGPKFRLLDVVVAWPDAKDELSRKGTVIQVGLYADTRFVYSVAPLDQTVATVFEEDDLVATLERCLGGITGRLRIRARMSLPPAPAAQRRAVSQSNESTDRSA